MNARKSLVPTICSLPFTAFAKLVAPGLRVPRSTTAETPPAAVVRQSVARATPAVTWLQPTIEPRSLVHPELLLQAVNRARAKGERTFLRDAKILYRQAVLGETPEEDWTHGYGQERLWG